jgi:hypothetical protein
MSRGAALVWSPRTFDVLGPTGSLFGVAEGGEAPGADGGWGVVAFRGAALGTPGCLAGATDGDRLVDGELGVAGC